MEVGSSGLPSSVGTGTSSAPSTSRGSHWSFFSWSAGRRMAVGSPPSGPGVAPLAVDGHGRGHDQLLHAAALVHQRLQQVRGAQGVDGGVVGDLVHALAHAHGGGQVVDHVDVAEAAAHGVRVAHVAHDELRVVGHPGGLAPVGAVHLRIEVVQDAHPVAARQQRVHQVAAHEPRPSRHQHSPNRHSPPPRCGDPTHLPGRHRSHAAVPSSRPLPFTRLPTAGRPSGPCVTRTRNPQIVLQIGPAYAARRHSAHPGQAISPDSSKRSAHPMQRPFRL